MNSPNDDYKFMKGIDNIVDLAYFTLFEKYMKLNQRGNDKLYQIDSTDQESILMKRTGGFPMPGMVYTFLYKGANFDIKTAGKTKSYTDLVPIVFCLRAEKDFFAGINLNTLPPQARLSFLQSFYDTFKDFLESEVDILAQNNKLALNKRFLSYIKGGKGKDLISFFNKSTGENFNFGYRKYKLGKAKQLRMIEYSEWKYIPFYEPKDAFRKLSYSQLYKLYGESRGDI
jgi:hypothetical protein